MGEIASAGAAAASTPRARFRGARRLLLGVVGSAIAALFFAVCIAAPLLHLSYSPVLTGSMRPSFAAGDLLITMPKAVTDLRPGQVAVFTPPGESAPYAHRITAVTGTARNPVLTTKGDANPAPDPWRAKLLQDKVPVVVATVPYAGNAFLWAQSPVQRAMFTALFGLSLTAFAVAWVLRAPSNVRGLPNPAPSA